ncbi:DUF551 domain-containing protein [Allopusillimonas ginsengisoli]|uniref:DUF551 domain-containing protein n=1 Tax=Allopusillimonas ginsengisoli TaxID=453575 RepID=UPI0014309DBE|nr:DUF551 domain-containing protein [Allopusillimonas ginsengisoli]
MTKPTMPEPVGFLVKHDIHPQSTGALHFDASFAQGDDDLSVAPLITTTQAQAYADARVREVQQWEPIETAPKHTEVLVWREDSGPFIAKLTDPYEVITVEEMERENLEFRDDFEEWYSDAYGWQEGNEKPTHWMPLPAPLQQ